MVTGPLTISRNSNMFLLKKGLHNWVVLCHRQLVSRPVGLEGLWASTAFISIILAFMNLLPIPALDGGHVMFLLYEMVSGRNPTTNSWNTQMAGFFLLLTLVIYANGNDLFRFLPINDPVLVTQ